MRKGRTETLYGILAPSGGGWLPLGDQSGVRIWRNPYDRDAELRKLNQIEWADEMKDVKD